MTTTQPKSTSSVRSWYTRNDMSYGIGAIMSVTSKVEKHYRLGNYSKLAMYLCAKIFLDGNPPDWSSHDATRRAVEACKRKGYVFKAGKRADGEFDCIVYTPDGAGWTHTENGDSWLGSTVFYAFLRSNQV